MIWIALAGAAAVLGACYHPVTVDEAWSLVVARRMLRGDRLYRDIFYGAAPLAILILRLLFALVRPQGALVRLLTIVYFCAAVGAAVSLVDGRPNQFLVAAAMIAVGGFHLHPHNHYGYLTTVGVLWGTVAVQAGRPWLGGALAGVAILGKYSVGLVGVAGLAAAAALIGSPADSARLLVIAFAVVGAAALARPEATRWFFRRAVANKRVYLDAGRAGPIHWLRARSWVRWDAIAVQLPVAVSMALVVTGPMVCLLFVLIDRSDAAIVGLVPTIAGLATAIPRFDGAHAVAATQLVVPGLMTTVDMGRAAWWFGTGALVLAALGIAGRMTLTHRQKVRRDLPGLKYLPVAPLAGGIWPDETDGLPTAVFILRLDAALVYASGGVSNPTPFDYPAASTFGSGGQLQVVRAFEDGMPICHGWTDTLTPLTPTELLAALPRQGGVNVRLGRLLRAGSPDRR